MERLCTSIAAHRKGRMAGFISRSPNFIATTWFLLGTFIGTDFATGNYRPNLTILFGGSE
jgi:hypothetical protein